jgi:hypothetical protein
VSVLRAWRNVIGQHELDELFTSLGRSFSDCTSYEFELLVAHAGGLGVQVRPMPGRDNRVPKAGDPSAAL